MTLDLIFDSSGSATVVAHGRPVISAAQTALYWQFCGQSEWALSTAVKTSASATVVEISDTEIQFSFGEVARLKMEFRREDAQTFLVKAAITNASDQPIELLRCHLLQGILTEPTGLFAITPFIAGIGRFYNPGDTLPASREKLEQLWQSMGVKWPRLADPVHDQPGWALAVDTGVVTKALDQPGLFFGFTSPVSAFGEIGIQTASNSNQFFAGLLLDGVRLDPGSTRSLDSLMIRAGDWQESSSVWAKACALAANVKTVRPPLVGYCSWYQFNRGVTAEHIERATIEVADWPLPPGGRTVQIDDGFQVMPGNWSPNSRFADGWETLPKRIESTGSIPGLWLAPHAIHQDHPIYRSNPEWFQRDAQDKPLVSFSNWTWCGDSDSKTANSPGLTYFLDPDHPDAQGFMRRMIEDAVNAGWKYIKLDFTYAVSTARKPWNQYKTRMETLRDMYALFRQAAGDSTILCSCIGEAGRYALGSVDTARIGGDIDANWHAVKSNVREMLMRLSTNGIWWNCDPDVFIMRTENASINSEEGWCLTGTVGLMGGVVLTSDFPSQWDENARKRVGSIWTKEGPMIPAASHVVFSADGTARAARFSYDQEPQMLHRVLIYNWSEDVASVSLSSEELGLAGETHLTVAEDPPNDFDGRLENGRLLCEKMPPHSLRIACLRGS